MSVFKKLRNDYVIWHANRIKLPDVTSNVTVRKKVIFAGRVQKVGFRLEVHRLAQRMGLTGWVRNLEDGSVEAEIQGEALYIDFLVNCMKSLKRACVKNMTLVELPNREGEEDFTILK
ncbi:acylphosphatase [Paenibacillus guangzhouensis]|uniref:acylphosphatase n=1 Tax=Paenibacillus guangzhouensis TaxID=1473112 RepID=UPI001266BA9C|nr:acylphosphatase [Paenibacillus guangzhouensis]